MTHDVVVRGDAWDVAADDGVIAAVGPSLGGGRLEVDARGLLVLPGAVDAHVHLNDPGRAGWEGFRTGTRALAAGGVTCAVVGFKAFMCPSGVDEFPAADPDTLGRGMERAAALGLPVAVHAEDPVLTGRLAHEARVAGRTGMRDWAASRPVEAELTAIGAALALAAETGCALHVVHVSSGEGVDLVTQARAAGVDATCEACPHHLALDEDDAVRIGALAKCAPPLRSSRERRALWRRVAAGAVQRSARTTRRVHRTRSGGTTCSRCGEGSRGRRPRCRCC